MMKNRGSFRTLTAVFCSLLSYACASPETGRGPEPGAGGVESLNVYSGRQRELVGPMMERFERRTGVEVNVKYGATAELAATLLEEGDRSPADLFFAQDAGALGAIAKKGMFATLPGEILDRVPPDFRSPNGDWVGITGRARTVVFATGKVRESDLPSSILDFTDLRWKDRVGWAPTNGSFQAFVTALRKTRGEGTARDWLAKMKTNNARSFPSNVPIVQAVAREEIDVGFVNHYYVLEMKKEDPQLKAQNHFFRNGDPGGLVNVSGIGILKSSNRSAVAQRLISFFLSADGQRHWTAEEFEYPLVAEVPPAEGLPPLAELRPPGIRLADLDDLEGTLRLLREVGLI